MKLSIVIPAFNEEENIEETLLELENYMNGYMGADGWEIVVVNDGSTDKTQQMVAELGRIKSWLKPVDLVFHYGRGKALRMGFEHASGEIIVSLDADLSYAPYHIERLVSTLEKEGADIVLASAYRRGGTARNVPFRRLWVSRIGNRILSYMFDGGVTVLTCLARAFRKDFIDRLDLNSDGKEIHLEILLKARMVGGKILEIPADLLWRQKKLAQIESRSHSTRRTTVEFGKTSNSHIFFALLSKPGFIFFVPGFLLMICSLVILTDKLWQIMESIFRGVPAYRAFRGSMTMASPSWAAIVVLFILAVQFFTLGFMTSQIKRVYEEIYKSLNAIYLRIEKK